MPGSGSNTPAGIDLGFDGDGDCGALTTLHLDPLARNLRLDVLSQCPTSLLFPQVL